MYICIYNIYIYIYIYIYAYKCIILYFLYLQDGAAKLSQWFFENQISNERKHR